MKRKFRLGLLPVIILILILLCLGFVFRRSNFIFKSDLVESSPAASVNNYPKLTFAVIGDPEGDLTNLKTAGQIVSQKGIKNVLLVGDLTNLGTGLQFQEVKTILDSWGVNYFTIPGNHDLWYGRKLCLEKNGIDCSNVDIYKQYFGQNYQVISLPFPQESILIDQRSPDDLYTFLLMDNSDEYLGFGLDQTLWLNQQFRPDDDRPLAEASGIQLPSAISHQPSIIFLHIPLYHPESNEYYVMGSESEAVKKQAEELLAKFCQNPPLALFFGHLHYSRQYEYSCPNGKKLKMFNVGSLNSQRNWQLPRLWLVTIKSNNELATEEIIL